MEAGAGRPVARRRPSRASSKTSTMRRRVGGRHGRTLQVSEAVVLALVTITAAWSGLRRGQLGNGAPGLQLAAASSARTEANRSEYTAQSLR